MTQYYREDLAHVHDAGFRDYALRSAPGILEILDGSAARGDLVVDLGCGSGLLARELTQAGYRVLGIDISAAMIDLARKRVPAAEFRVGSLFEAEIPLCGAVTAVGEVLNYLFDPYDDAGRLDLLFRRVHDSLVPGGVFVFDVAEPGQMSRGVTTRVFTEGEDWVVLAEKEEDAERAILTRRIITFRKVGEYYRRDHEVHRQRLYEAKKIAAGLRGADLQVRTLRAYGRHDLPEAHAAFIARKPA